LPPPNWWERIIGKAGGDQAPTDDLRSYAPPKAPPGLSTVPPGGGLPAPGIRGLPTVPAPAGMRAPRTESGGLPAPGIRALPTVPPGGGLPAPGIRALPTVPPGGGLPTPGIRALNADELHRQWDVAPKIDRLKPSSPAAVAELLQAIVPAFPVPAPKAGAQGLVQGLPPMALMDPEMQKQFERKQLGDGSSHFWENVNPNITPGGRERSRRIMPGMRAPRSEGGGRSRGRSRGRRGGGRGWTGTAGDVDTSDAFGSMAKVRSRRSSKNRARVSGEFNYALTKAGRKKFGKPGTNITTITAGGKRFKVNAAAASRIKGFVDELVARGYDIKSIGGYNYRNKESGGLSTHATGTSIDIDPFGLGNDFSTKTVFPEEVEKLAWRYGLSWGVRFGDAMHFETMSPDLHSKRLTQLYKEGYIGEEELRTSAEQNNLKIPDELPKVHRPGLVDGLPSPDAPEPPGAPEMRRQFERKPRAGGRDPLIQQHRGGGRGGIGSTPPAGMRAPRREGGRPDRTEDGSAIRTTKRGRKNIVNKDDLRRALISRISNSKLNGLVPPDGPNYGITTGAPEEWANMMFELVDKESSYDAANVTEEGGWAGGSRGLFQLSRHDGKNYEGKAWTNEQIADPLFNVDKSVMIAERNIIKKGTVKGGMGAYWGPVRRGWKPSRKSVANITRDPAQRSNLGGPPPTTTPSAARSFFAPMPSWSTGTARQYDMSTGGGRPYTTAYGQFRESGISTLSHVGGVGAPGDPNVSQAQEATGAVPMDTGMGPERPQGAPQPGTAAFWGAGQDTTAPPSQPGFLGRLGRVFSGIAGAGRGAGVGPNLAAPTTPKTPPPPIMPPMPQQAPPPSERPGSGDKSVRRQQKNERGAIVGGERKSREVEKGSKIAPKGPEKETPGDDVVDPIDNSADSAPPQPGDDGSGAEKPCII